MVQGWGVLPASAHRPAPQVAEMPPGCGGRGDRLPVPQPLTGRLKATQGPPPHPHSPHPPSASPERMQEWGGRRASVSTRGSGATTLGHEGPCRGGREVPLPLDGASSPRLPCHRTRGDSGGESHPSGGFSHPSPAETQSRGGVGAGGGGAGPPLRNIFSPLRFIRMAWGCPYPAPEPRMLGWLPKRGRGEATVLGKLRQCWPGASPQPRFGASIPPCWARPPNFKLTPQPVHSAFPLQKLLPTW